MSVFHKVNSTYRVPSFPKTIIRNAHLSNCTKASKCNVRNKERNAQFHFLWKCSKKMSNFLQKSTPSCTNAIKYVKIKVKQMNNKLIF